MEDDLISSLTRQVKEEVIENYLTERSIIGLQVEDLKNRAETARLQAVGTGRRLSRLAYLAIQPESVEKLRSLLNISPNSFWNESMRKEFSRGAHFIKVRALTDKGKFRKLVLEAYKRLFHWMEKYAKSYANLESECRAVNSNIVKFRNNFDLLNILRFLKDMDTVTLERKQFLGENFSAQEITSVDKKLYVNTVTFEDLNAPPPISLPKPETLDAPLIRLANEIYDKYQYQVKHLMK
ncbi:MAG: hypothetical protein AB2L11_04720 [Syntrophobacteraceae bacterium]